MHWIALGDIHESTSIFDEIPDLDTARGVIITGDITNRGTPAAARSVLSALRRHNPNLLAQPGNMDTEDVAELLREEGIDLHCRVHELAPGLGIMGVGYSTPTPFNTPGEVDEEVLAEWLDQTHAQAGRFEKLIVVVHEPPGQSRLDVLGNGQHVGSMAVRRFIERAMPELVITGHIHESGGTDIVGQTMVINPGMAAGGGYVRIDFANGQLSARLENV
ncbi:metallophosphoesterase family protein [Pseudodesulfovibrio senegalensis]|jgi:hypothetical protein|uniref:Serine/threonine protein phosphatase n=1 Tax=Pseudodesulfovibrio senegalensis TaxID=1721087 RepID=A0A6N6N206_9BACT|nr:metallophosphoesterase [Pseudodesulfovibrio senegalensis]KAB1441760.1 serine/threonine protein phosphatase [Pseudodesulfovibrio senegalensis]